MIRKIRHVLEAAIVWTLHGFFGLLPFELASAIGGFLGRTFGPMLKVTDVAQKNLTRAFPEMTERQLHATLVKMWDNLGRVATEFPHMALKKGRAYDEIVQVEGLEHIRDLTNSKQSVIFFSGHFANWEIVPKTIFEKGFPSVHLVYRKSNNPYIDKLILQIRNHYQEGCMPKGTAGARQLIQAIRQGKPIGMLVDQKQNDGLAVPFFGRDAMTASAIANLTLKYDCILIPIYTCRTGGARFKARFYPPLTIARTGDEKQDILAIMTSINQMLEEWIRADPKQWFWVHNRWPKENKP